MAFSYEKSTPSVSPIEPETSNIGCMEYQRIRIVFLMLLFLPVSPILPLYGNTTSHTRLLNEVRETVAMVQTTDGPSMARTNAAEHLADLTRKMNPKDIDDKTLAELVSLLDTPDDSVRAWVAAAIGNLGSRARTAGPALLKLLPETDCLQGDLTSAAVIRPALKRIGVKPPPPTNCAGGDLPARSNADWDWMSNHFAKALDDLFPINERYGVYIAYRSHRDLNTDVPEYSFVIGTEKSDSVSGLPRYLAAYVREAESASVYDQMMAQHRKFPNRSADDIQKDVHVKKLKLTEMGCPAIKVQFSKLQQTRFALPQFDVVILHPLLHEFRIRTGGGDLDVALYDDENSLVSWAVGTRHALELCATSAIEPPTAK
ncbi:MAG TPA: HEAT repeat domain-containing protein [Chthoniobacterales bacterium]|jgi:hypothetical protein|nr:HEAT repeat domain-containing protein [Chthoniobacterales bacterium]